MNVYDFDGTIYDGDSTIDFYFYCLKCEKRVLLALPKQIRGVVLYFSKKINKTQLKEYFYSFLMKLDDTNIIVEAFWLENHKKVMDWYINQQKDDDVVISASPEFLLKPICSLKGIRYLIASNVDINSGIYTGLNCYGEEKVNRFKSIFPNESVNWFYSDSKADKPMAELARESFTVNGGKIYAWKN